MLRSSRYGTLFRRWNWVGLLGALFLAALASPRESRPAAAAPAPSETGEKAAPAKPTFSRDVAPLLWKNCVSCHRAGAIGPFPLLSFADAQKRARLLAAVTEKRVMPPWKPQSHGEFLDEKRLTDGEILTLKRWAAQGAPEGNRADLPPAPKFKEGWQLGEPDLVLKMPAAFPIPAEGDDVYQHFVFQTNLPSDRWIEAVEMRPSNPRVAHHAIGLLDTSGTARKKDAETKEMGYGNFGGAGFLPAGLTPGYVPGQTPRRMTGSGIYLKKGADFVLQMHYHPSGKPETDQTMVGLYLTDKKPQKSPSVALLGSSQIDIAPGEAAYTVRDRFKLPVAMTVGSVWPHMHLLGKSVRVWAMLPGGEKRSLLHIPDWNFAWQDTYLLKNPMRLPKGTIIEAEFVFDNSSNNPRNPNNPPRRVLIGERSQDEMAGLVLSGHTDNWATDLHLLGAVVGHYVDIERKGEGAKKRAEEVKAKARR